MTTLGKLLVFLTLVAGVGVAVAGIDTYTQKRPWFNPAPTGGVDKGQDPVSFASLSAEIDGLGKAAAAASAAWGADLGKLRAAEKLRDDRRGKLQALLTLATSADPAKREAGFFNLKEDAATRLLNLDDRASVVKGADGLPLGGTDKLLGRFEADTAAINGTVDPQGVARGGLAREAADLRTKYQQLTAEVGLTEARGIKQRAIRDNLLDEAAYLAAFQVNVAGDLGTVKRRLEQLQGRLRLVSGTPAP